MSNINDFEINLKEIQKKARQKMENGAVTSSYGADREKVISVLNEMLATEIVCALRYKSHYHLASGILSKPIADEFLEHYKEELSHGDRIAERIAQLEGIPNFNPEGLLSRAHAEFVEESNLIEQIKENLVAERVAIETYSEVIKWLGDSDPTTRRMLEQILEQEEEHADELSDLLEKMNTDKKLLH